MKALLFINGKAPRVWPDLEGYALVACTDGAFRYLEALAFPLARLDFVSGDFDSLPEAERLGRVYDIEVIPTPDQDKTDFHKALEILFQRGVLQVDVYGASGGEMDHFLGNLTVAFAFREKLELRFFDEYSTYYFIPEEAELKGVYGRTISLYPFPVAHNVRTEGLRWRLNGETLDQTVRIGTRNIAEKETVSIGYSGGSLLVFVGEE
ncbi:thiamine diphosphokinase [Bergeyella sp. RCAD1439]|uniref:thiamine diphosphokinase n=1 Tax=Bergeyella anatis TaxID=3113737 RepID=UPI002E19A1E3|nr:thiamine diphosphokinase [Bergeyella sp. RCAD1439]